MDRSDPAKEGCQVLVPRQLTAQDVSALFEGTDHKVDADAVTDISGGGPLYYRVDFQSKQQADDVMARYKFIQRPLPEPILGLTPDIGEGSLSHQESSKKTSTMPKSTDLVATNWVQVWVDLKSGISWPEVIKDMFPEFKIENFLAPVQRMGSFYYVRMETEEQADKAVEEWNGKMVLGYTLKVDHGYPDEQRMHNGDPEPTSKDGTSVWVGSIQHTNSKRIRQGLVVFFREFRIRRISEIYRPKNSAHSCYCFVSLETKKQAYKAVKKLNGRSMWGSPLLVKPDFQRPKQSV